MNINIKDVLTLSDKNRYVITSKVNYENKEYVLLIDINNNENIKFCYIDNDEIIEINNKDLVTKLLPLFYNASKDLLPQE